MIIDNEKLDVDLAFLLRAISRCTLYLLPAKEAEQKDAASIRARLSNVLKMPSPDCSGNPFIAVVMLTQEASQQ